MISDVKLIYTGENDSLRDAVYYSLKKAIMTGVLDTGDRLMEVHIANHFGVSRTPVREAIHRLEQERLVISSHRSGARVAGISHKAVQDALDVRIGIETMSVRFAAVNITPEQLAELRDINAKIRETLKSGAISQVSDLDNLLHRKIGEATGNNVLMEIMAMLEQHVLRYRFEYIKQIINDCPIADEHDRIIDAIEKGDIQTACDYMMEHIKRQRDGICEIILNKLNN